MWVFPWQARPRVVVNLENGQILEGTLVRDHPVVVLTNVQALDPMDDTATPVDGKVAVPWWSIVTMQERT